MSLFPMERYRKEHRGIRQTWAALAVILLIVGPFPVRRQSTAGEGSVLFRETFDSLDKWKPVTFPRIRTHSTYTVERDASGSFLRTESRASASAIMYSESFDVYRYPRMRWRWKVRNLYAKKDAARTAGDDFPIRINVMFLYDRNNADMRDRMKYGMAKALHGEYPPQSSLCYVWSSREYGTRIITNPYTSRAKEILLRQGASQVGTWQNEEVDLLSDYQAAFGEKPPEKAEISIMNDSDDTGESSVSWVDDLEVFR
jgi:hypothetical protein